MSMINEFVGKLRGRLKKELQLADEDKRKADVLQFDRAVGYANGMAIAIDMLNKLAEEYKDITNTNNNSWVSCSEKCPPNDTYCLITDYKGDIRIEKHLSGNEWYAGFNYVVAWQPLPEPYKGE